MIEICDLAEIAIRMAGESERDPVKREVGEEEQARSFCHFESRKCFELEIETSRQFDIPFCQRSGGALGFLTSPIFPKSYHTDTFFGG
jgi:hypothetical protein